MTTMNRQHLLVGLAALCCITPTLAAQTTYHVSATCGDDAWTGLSPVCEAPDGPKQTIRAAIAVTSDGDTVIVADGIYTGNGNRALTFNERRILLRSENGPGNCIIDAEGAGIIFFMADYLTPDTIIDGFTIRGGQSSEGGAFWFHHGNAATIRNCIIANNSATMGGAVLTRITASPTFINCAFIGNTAQRGGAIAAIHQSAPTFINCLFYDNTATIEGGAVSNENMAVTTLINSTITQNISLGQVGALRLVTGAMQLRNTIVWENQAPSLPPITIGSTSLTAAANLTVSHSLIEGGQEGILVQGSGALNWLGGNLWSDPLFVNPAAGNFRLRRGSPAIDAGDNTLLPLHIVTDLEGNPRFIDDPATPNTGIPGGAGGPAITDLGAYEFQASCYANCDGSTTPPILNVEDFTCFINQFAAAHALPHQQQLIHYANCDHSTMPPVLNVEDFTCFINAFAAGCP
jgi:hypothetical protein